MRNKVVYTAIFRKKDKPIQQIKHKDWEYHLYTEDTLHPKSPTRLVGVSNPRMMAKRLKILSLDAKYSLWIDGNIELLQEPEAFLQYLGDNDIATFAHPEGRDCIYQEALEVIKQKKDTPENVNEQMKLYKTLGYPEHFGLSAGTIVLRRHTKEIEYFNELWWKMISRFSHRDQLSFNYCLWVLNMKCSIIPGNLFFDNDLVKRHPHLHKD